MPGMDGFETADALYQGTPGLGIIIVAEGGGPNVRRKAADVGVRGFVSKTRGRKAFREVVRLVREGRWPLLVEIHGRVPGSPPR